MIQCITTYSRRVCPLELIVIIKGSFGECVCTDGLKQVGRESAGFR